MFSRMLSDSPLHFDPIWRALETEHPEVPYLGADGQSEARPLPTQGRAGLYHWRSCRTTCDADHGSSPLPHQEIKAFRSSGGCERAADSRPLILGP